MSKKEESILKRTQFTAVNIGRLDDVSEYSLIHPKTGKVVNGKKFIKDITDATGTEISFTTIPPKTPLGYFHHHHQNEETYVVFKGSGQFQIDNDVFEIEEGSIIRVAPEGKRSLCNTSDSEPLVYLVIQSKAGSLEQHTSDDGSRDAVESRMRVK